MMLITSPSALCIFGNPEAQLTQALKVLAAAGTPVVLVSNHAQPVWFDQHFSGSPVAFLRHPGRQTGQVVKDLAAQHNVQPHELFVLASSVDDMRMGKNGGAILIAAGWSDNPIVRALGIKVTNDHELLQTMQLIDNWKGQWWFSGAAAHYQVRALADLSGMNVTAAQQAFGARVTAVAKNGGVGLNALLAVLVRSLMGDGAHGVADQFWGVYPSSSSENDDDEVLSDFTHRIRTTVSKVRMARRGEPLFIRHAASTKRSKSSSANRQDPTEQIQTIHLNPAYAANLWGRNVYLIDDCTTYGVSFGVASAFLRKAGSASVTGIALGKFGNVLKQYDIEIGSDPFKPVTAFKFGGASHFAVHGNAAAQQDLLALLP